MRTAIDWVQLTCKRQHGPWDHQEEPSIEAPWHRAMTIGGQCFLEANYDLTQIHPVFAQSVTSGKHYHTSCRGS